MNLVGRHVGNYVVQAKVGEGGMGEVYLCEHVELGRKAVIKVLHEELSAQDDIVERFFHEAKAANEIGHPNIIDVYDFGHLPGVQNELVYILMEFLDGASIGSRLRHEGLSDRDVLHIMAQCCDALAASHHKGIIHRDLKPENIYVITRAGDRNFVKILDFGIAKLVGEQHNVHQTRAGVALGTPSYMSPEQCAATGHIDARSDIYSLGVVLYELLTRRLPFEGQTHTEIMLGHMTQTPPPPSAHRPDLSPELEAIVLHAMEKDRDHRFQSMEEMAAAVADPARHIMAYEAQLAERGKVAAAGVHSGHTMHLDGGLPPPAAQDAPITDRPTMHMAGGMQTGPTVAAATPTHLTPTHSTPQPHVTPTHMTPQPHVTPTSETALVGAPATPIAAELAASVHTRRILTLIAAASGVVAVGSLVGMLVMMTRGPRAPKPAPTAVSAKTPAARPAAPPVAPLVPALISVNVRSEPAGARVDWADRGVVAGNTPLTLNVRRGEPAFMLRLSLDGYAPVMQRVETERDSDVTVTLKHLTPEPPPPPSAPPPEKRKSGDKRPGKRAKPVGEILMEPAF